MVFNVSQVGSGVRPGVTHQSAMPHTVLLVYAGHIINIPYTIVLMDLNPVTRDYLRILPETWA